MSLRVFEPIRISVENTIYDFHYCIKYNYLIINHIMDLNLQQSLRCYELSTFLFIQFFLKYLNLNKNKNGPFLWFKFKYIEI